MILSRRALSSLNLSSYQATWTHFRPNFMIFEQIKISPNKNRTFQVSGKQVRIHREGIFPKVVRLET